MAATGLTDAQQQTWIATLTEMIDEGPMIVRRLPKLRQAIICHPQPLLWYTAQKLELEIILLEMAKELPYISGNLAVGVLGLLFQHGLSWRVVEILNDVFENMGYTDAHNLFDILDILNRMFI
ncbi:hypothetical protein DPMN_028099 [Dreissena polymorpha]|uniref:Uncharacterized protein n=1 Tax=Dreissena polymorpha TaxID=45954 RepID=A0A9D4LYC0_DREPO|nr:hypothetical protein DPMN_028099 [Dreissena polymorpha]